MDLYDRYRMRPSGESKLQARTPAEAAAFTTFDVMEKRGMLGTMSVSDRRDFMNELHEDLERAITRVLGIPQ